MELLNVLYSVAGVKDREVYDLLLELDSKLLSSKEGRVLSYLLGSYEKSESFVSYKLLVGKFGEYPRVCSTVTDIRVSLQDILKLRRRDIFIEGVQQVLVEGADVGVMQGDIRVLLENSGTGVELERFEDLRGYYERRKEIGEGFKTGVKDVDEITGGFQSGTMTAVAAWTSQGKSTFWLNASYRNMLIGRKVVIISMEIPKEMVYQQLLSRLSYDSGEAIAYERIFKAELSSDEEEVLFGKLSKELSDSSGEVLVLDNSDFENFDYSGVFAVLRKAERLLGGLDYVVVDHINLFRYVNPNPNITGDHYVKVFNDIARDYRCIDGSLLGVGLAVQVNRQGWSRAVRKEGVYDLLALSEFREIERSSTVVLFLYSDSYMMKMNEMKVQILKNRIGRVMDEPVVTYVYAACSVVGQQFGVSDGDVGEAVNGFLGEEGNDDNFYI